MSTDGVRDWFYFSPLEMGSVESLSSTSEADLLTASQEAGLEVGRPEGPGFLCFTVPRAWLFILESVVLWLQNSCCSSRCHILIWMDLQLLKGRGRMPGFLCLLVISRTHTSSPSSPQLKTSHRPFQRGHWDLHIELGPSEQ